MERQSNYSGLFLLSSSIFVTCLITSNIIAVKLIEISGIVLPAAIIVFPLSYIFGDILTEVYGYSAARKVIWLGFLCNLIFVLASHIAGILPPAKFWDGQASYERILGYAPRLLFASFSAYLLGEFSNSFVLAKLKIKTKGRFLWVRTITSTLVGQGIDSLVFITLAFYGEMPHTVLLLTVIYQWLAKTIYEALFTPLTYVIVNFLKRKEGMDVFDYETRFNPLLIRD
ncbi:MAG: queuosine precursor transporter [Desulfobacterota bacterium]|nr:queuosine precursor transporter [Thermodesulfobacteriota bacterium]MDW8002371.1 queuosine precursor transporter [Deltaproteobacteria bacterium]